MVAIASTQALAADWQPVATAGSERVEIDKSSILRTAKGETSAWTRHEFGRDLTENGIRYTALETLNHYDCAARTFKTFRRVYLLSGKAVRAETVSGPDEESIAAGSVDDQLLKEACKPRTVGEAHKIAEAAAKAAAMASEAAKTMPIADAGQPEAKAETMPAAKPIKRPRFFELPKIDKSKVEDPYAGMTPEQKAAAIAAERAATEAAEQKTGKSGEKTEGEKAEAKPAETAKAKPAEKPAAKVPEKPAVSARERREIEREYATSGPRHRTRRVHKKKAPPPPAPIYANVKWGYQGAGGPANWAKLRPDYAICASGRRQSPIDIRDGIRVDLEPIKFDYKLSRFRIVDTGHTIRVAVGEGSTITITGRTYQLQRLEFHRPAEEQVNGRGYDMDIQFIHEDDAGDMAIVVVLLEAGGKENPQIQTLWNNLPLEVDRDVTPLTPIELKALLPENRDYYTYIGSLTTPPCTEEVLWMVLKQPMRISNDQLAIFSHLYKNNARPIQPSNGRLIKESR